MTKILTQAQAQAVYSAMKVLNQVGGYAHLHLPPIFGHDNIPIRKDVHEDYSGRVMVRLLGYTAETYDSKSAFATAYGLQQD